jgi:ATP-binding cassette subfamily C protein CydD
LHLAQAKVLDFVEQQSQGLDYKVGEQASTLSVGQAQRIALARALGQKAHLFLLDEPTASLDSHSEQAVQQALRESMASATCLMVTHRLDQLHLMDNILVLDNGIIAEQGSFEQLDRREGLFKQMQQEAVDHITSLDEVKS